MPGSSLCNGHLCLCAVRCGYPLSAAPTLWARPRAVIESGGAGAGRPREAAARTPARRYASVHTVPIRRNFGAKKQSCANAAAGGHGAHKYAREIAVRLRLRPEGRYGRCGCAWCPPRATCDVCGAGRGPDRGQEKQAYRENEVKRSRVRGPRAAAHLPKRPCRRPVGGGRGGARPPTQ